MKDSHPLPSIELDLLKKLQDPEYRERFFLAEASAEIARQLIALRKRRRLSQTELAQRANTQQPAVSRAEQADYHNWSFNTLRKLTNAMEGRLRVIIEPWEDVLDEYYPEDREHTVPAPVKKEVAKPASGEERRKFPPSAAAGGAAPSDLGALSGERPRDFNVERGLIARMQERKELTRDQGRSQWS